MGELMYSKSSFFYILLLILFLWKAEAQRLSSGFEVRYFSHDPDANGETDFKGETSVFSTEDRMEFLKYYAQNSAAWFEDEDLNTEVVTDAEAREYLKSIKPQPLPRIRDKIILDQWKWLNCKPGQHESSQREIQKYKGAKDIFLQEGALSFLNDSGWKWDFENQTWRFFFEWRMKIEDESAAELTLGDNASGREWVRIFVEKGVVIHKTISGNDVKIPLKTDQWHVIRIETDLKDRDDQYFRIYLDGQFVAESDAGDEEISQINYFKIHKAQGLALENIYGVGYHPTQDVSYPFYPRTFMDIDFQVDPDVVGWQNEYYDDSSWRSGSLPLSHGSERHEGEDLFLRKELEIGSYKKAFLNIETIDPGGEIWINGQMVALIRDRYPIRLDISDYLLPNTKNLIALKVDHFYLNPKEGIPSPHSPLDKNPNWFAGRAWLDLTEETLVEDAFLYTEALEENRAEIRTDVLLQHLGNLGFSGKVKINMTPWDDSGSSQKVTEHAVLLGPGQKKLELKYILENPKLWTPESPDLYKVEILIEDDQGELMDDFVFTTGIRILSQENGQFHLNGKPSMLNGTQIMGFRSPMEKMMAWLRSPPDEWVAKELLQTRKMNCNMLRIHVHGWKETAVGINDPRYAEMADQMGIMLIATTPAWIREGDWGQVDFEGYHRYMEMVQNHPSVVMWEISNHPNTFNKNPNYESDLFIETAYNAVYPYDPSRLISFTSHIAHMKYGNDAGTIDKGGRNISAPIRQEEGVDPGDQMRWNQELFSEDEAGAKIDSFYAWTAPMVTRGNQDAPTGYGKEWSALRKWPNAYTRDFLESKERAYFNFEHQESIGQPNWEMSRGKPWYKLQSYEWDYDSGSIGRRLSAEEWKESQAWQAFSAYEATKKMRQLDYDGFSWCSLHGGANSATYKKPAIDFLGYGKLVFYIHKIMFQPVLAGSKDVDVVYGPEDVISPVVMNLGEAKDVNLTILIRDQPDGEVIDKTIYKNINLEEGRTVVELNEFHPKVDNEGLYFIEYLVDLER